MPVFPFPDRRAALAPGYVGPGGSHAARAACTYITAKAVAVQAAMSLSEVVAVAIAVNPR